MAHRLPTETCETLYGLVRGSELRSADGVTYVSLHTADRVTLPSGRSTAPRSESPEPSPVWTNAETVTVSYIVGFDGSRIDIGDSGFVDSDITWDGFTLVFGQSLPASGLGCQTCWSVQRWPWEPARSCAWNVDPASTLCDRHKVVV